MTVGFSRRQPLDDVVKRLRVRDIMSRLIISAEPDTTVADLVDLMLEMRIHRVVITRNGGVVGLVTSQDLLRVQGHQWKILRLSRLSMAVGARQEEAG